MEQIPAERAMRVREVMLRAITKQITWWQAAEILGVSPRTMRRWKFGAATLKKALEIPGHVLVGVPVELRQ